MGTVARVLGLDAPHLLLNLLHADLATEDGGNSQVPALSGIGSSHHVFGIKHLLCQLGDAQGTELVTSTRGQGRESDHEKVQTRKGDHVDGEFSQVRVELAGETETGGDAGHDGGDEVVKVAVGGGIKFESTDADIIQSLIVNAKGFVRVFNELLHTGLEYARFFGGKGTGGCYVNREGGIVRLDDGVGDLW